MCQNVTTCAAALACAVVGWWAFPADVRHYQEFSKGVSPSCKEQAATPGTLKETLKPTLAHINFCPFCGSSELKLEGDESFPEGAACPCCRARHIPLSLVVLRGRMD